MTFPLARQLTPAQRDGQKAFQSFAETVVEPRADAIDRDQLMPPELVRALAGEGYLCATLPCRATGEAMDMVSYGLLTEELGRACSSVRNLVAVTDMVAFSLWRWGSARQQRRWLSALATGTAGAAFALTEPGVGSDAKRVTATATRSGSAFILSGRKTWISFAEIADVLLVFAQYDGAPTAFLVERATPGLAVSPIRGLLGLRGSMLGEVILDGCRVPAGSMLGAAGAGLALVASGALDLGRYSTAWGSVGLAQACLSAAARYAGDRIQYDVPIRDHQLVQAMLADMLTSTAAARLLCHHAGLARSLGDPDAVNQTLIAKYHASSVAMRVASDAVQIHGAQGVGADRPVQRYFRDAKVMEIIEGTSQIHQLLLGLYAERVSR